MSPFDGRSRPISRVFCLSVRAKIDTPRSPMRGYAVGVIFRIPNTGGKIICRY